jgi:hypothetical protein
MAPRIVLQLMQMLLALVQALMASRKELALENLALRHPDRQSRHVSSPVAIAQALYGPTAVYRVLGTAGRPPPGRRRAGGRWATLRT